MLAARFALLAASPAMPNKHKTWPTLGNSNYPNPDLLDFVEIGVQDGKHF
jgi:hypothetical protein